MSATTARDLTARFEIGIQVRDNNGYYEIPGDNDTFAVTDLVNKWDLEDIEVSEILGWGEWTHVVSATLPEHDGHRYTYFVRRGPKRGLVYPPAAKTGGGR